MRIRFGQAALLAAVLASLGAPSARAEDFGFADDDPQRYRSPQQFELEFKGGPYSPDIDATPGLHGTPFADLFGDVGADGKAQKPGGTALLALELDWQFWRPFGSFALAGSVGWNRRSAYAFRYVDDAGQTPCTVPLCQRSGDETKLTVIPLELMLVYRFDVAALRWNVPIVPYIKAGLGYYLWFIQRGDGNFARSLPDANGQTDRAVGGTAGFVLHPGVSIMLDAFDPSSAQALDSELGINHVHVFGELNYASITGLGIGTNKMVLSDSSWTVGLGLEF